MKVSLMKNSLALVFLSTALLTLNVACSSDEKPEGDEVVAAEEGTEEPATAKAEAASDEEVKQSEDVLKSDDDSKTEDVVDQSGPASKSAVMPEPPAAPTTPAKAAPAATKAAESVSSNTKRAVWFVKTDAAVVHDKPNAKAKQVGTMNRGDHFVAEQDGEWAKITDSRWVSVKDLSAKPVARKRASQEWSSGGAVGH